MTRSIDLEHARCALCGSDEADTTPYGDGPFRVVRCRVCRAWYLSPRLCEAAMVAAYKQAEYFEGGGSGYAAYALQRRSLLATFRRLIKQLEYRGILGPRLLDVGCGYGYFLEAAGGRVTSRVGTDFSRAAAREARMHADAVFVGGVSALPSDVEFDCIVSLHVIEHVYDPRSFVTSLFERVSPQGWLVIATPDMGSAWRHVLRNRWPSLKAPEHVVFYDQPVLRRLLGELPRAGRVLRIPYPHAFPVSEVCAKLSLPAPRAGGRLNLWIPGTTLCLAVQRI